LFFKPKLSFKKVQESRSYFFKLNMKSTKEMLLTHAEDNGKIIKQIHLRTYYIGSNENLYLHSLFDKNI
jgi:hypothetical protein